MGVVKHHSIISSYKYVMCLKAWLWKTDDFVFICSIFRPRRLKLFFSWLLITVVRLHCTTYIVFVWGNIMRTCCQEATVCHLYCDMCIERRLFEWVVYEVYYVKACCESAVPYPFLHCQDLRLDRVDAFPLISRSATSPCSPFECFDRTYLLLFSSLLVFVRIRSALFVTV